MRYLITGATGQLGYDIKRELLKRNVEESDILTPTRSEMDITNRKETMKTILEWNPDIIFHCAAYTSVDASEIDQQSAYNINVIGTKNVVDASIEIGAKLFYISTDYVFDGTKNGMYIPEDKVNPKNVYGKTKNIGEEEARRNKKHFITRISWLFGINGNNFIKTMLKLSENYDTVNVVDDQIGSPTYTVDLAHLLIDMTKTNKYGTYHITNEGFCSWAEFAEYIFKVHNKKTKVNRVSTEEYLELTKSNQAYRPKNSKLDKLKLLENGFNLLPDWKDATDRYEKELTKIKRM